MDKTALKKEAIECCVICGKPTEYRIDTPIGKRECYVEGVGQLCRECYFEIYLKQGNEGTS